MPTSADNCAVQLSEVEFPFASTIPLGIDRRRAQHRNSE